MKVTSKIIGFVLLFVIIFIGAVYAINYIRMDLSKEEAAIVSDVKETLEESGQRIGWLSFVRITRSESEPRLLRDIKSNKPVEAKKGEYFLISFSQTLWQGPSPTYVVDPVTREIIGYIPGLVGE